MKLDRNIEGNEGRGKYALLKLRDLPGRESRKGYIDGHIWQALDELDSAGVLDWGMEGEESEFFVVRLKDKHAQEALEAYALSIQYDDPEFAREVEKLAMRAGPNHPNCKKPD